VFEVQSALLELDQKYGAAASSPVRLLKDDLAALDGTTFRRLWRDMGEYASIGGLTMNSDASPWSGAKIVTTEQAESALLTTRRLSTRTLPDTRTAMDQLLEQAGFREPSSVAGWRDLLAFLYAVATTLKVLDAAVFAGPLAQMVAATASRKWRRRNNTWPGATTAWSERRRLAKAAAGLWHGRSRPSRAQLHAALATAAEQQAKWTTLTVDGGPPRVPPTLDEVSGRYEQLVRELASLSDYLNRNLSAENIVDLAATVDRLAGDER
jgi:hypothetical protein